MADLYWTDLTEIVCERMNLALSRPRNGQILLVSLISAPLFNRRLTRASPSLRLTAIIRGVQPAPSYNYVRHETIDTQITNFGRPLQTKEVESTLTSGSKSFL